MLSLVTCVAFNCIFHLVNSEQSKMEGFIVQGSKAKIERFPHAAFMSLTCEENNVVSRWKCGASILNQLIFLSAAHCFDACRRKNYIILSVGHVHRLKGQMTKVREFRVHQFYRVGKLAYDIALVRGQSPLTFNRKIRRIAIMGNPPYFEAAEVSGWGFVDEIQKTATDLLYYAQQLVMDRNHCKKIIKNLQPGTFCAQGKGYASLGDSGSALVVRGYIQIGLVSYKNPDISKRVIVYTDVGYYYKWIATNAEELLCQ